MQNTNQIIADYVLLSLFMKNKVQYNTVHAFSAQLFIFIFIFFFFLFIFLFYFFYLITVG